MNLIRGGFFKRLKERDLRFRLMKLEQERQKLRQEAKSAGDAESVPRLVEPASVTEATTRELEEPTQQIDETSHKKTKTEN